LDGIVEWRSREMKRKELAFSKLAEFKVSGFDEVEIY